MYYYIYVITMEIARTLHEPTQTQPGLRPHPSSQPKRLPHSIHIYKKPAAVVW